MTLPALIAVSLFASGQEPSLFTVRQAVAEPTRLALTPSLDGQIRADEWDAFSQSGDGETFFQWEPGKLYFGGRLKSDRELVVSLDLKGDGWLIGRDNYEFRFRNRDGRATVSSRRLDATRESGPVWVDQPSLERAASVTGSEGNGEAQIEALVQDPGLDVLSIGDKSAFGVRMDLAMPGSGVAYLPRAMTAVRLATARASAMPVGVNWKVEDPGRDPTPGRKTSVRFSFSANVDPGFKKIEVRPMGGLANQAKALNEAFPAFQKGRSFVDYEASTSRTAPVGYHLLTATLFTADGIPSMIQASMRVSPLVDFLVPTNRFSLKKGVQEFKIPFYIKSNSILRLDGSYEVHDPTNWTLKRGSDQKFLIYNSRGSVRRVLTAKIPADAEGPTPLRFSAQIGDRTVDQYHWITIDRD